MPHSHHRLAAAAVLLSPFAASAQAWPSRSVTMMVPLPAGGIADLLARGVAQALSDELGQPFVVENRAGASGNLAAAAVAKARARRLQPAFCHAGSGRLQQVHVREPAVRSGARSRAGRPGDQIADGRCRRLECADREPAGHDRLCQGQSGQAHHRPRRRRLDGHVAFELLQQKTGIVLNGVPYKGGAPMVTDLLGGHLPLGSDLLSNFIQLAKDKKVRLLAVATAQRMSDLPDVPTVQELIHAPFEAAAWFTIMARAGTPADIVQKVNAVTNRYLQSAKAKELIARRFGRGWRRHAGRGRGVREARARKVGAGDQGGEHFAELVGVGLGFQAEKLNASSILRRLKPLTVKGTI